jgi:predicted phage replisome organizer
MSDNKKYYYFRLTEDFFDKDNMKIIESQPNGYIYSNILLKLYLRSLKGNGRLMMTDRIPYDPDKIDILARVIGHDMDHVKQALKIACDLDKMTILDSGEIWVNDIQNYIGRSSNAADRKRKYRMLIDNKVNEAKKDKPGTNVLKCPDKSLPELELKLKKDIEKDIKKELHLSLVAYFNEKFNSGNISFMNNKSKEIEKARDFYYKLTGTPGEINKKHEKLILAVDHYLTVPNWYNWTSEKNKTINKSRMSFFHFLGVIDYVLQNMEITKTTEMKKKICEKCGYELTGNQGFCPDCRKKEVLAEREDDHK